MKKIIFFALMILLVLPLVSSINLVFKQSESVDIRVTPTVNGSINSVTVNITVTDPDGVVLVSFQEMQKNLGSQDFNYTLPGSNTSKLGRYDYTVYTFSPLAENQAFGFQFEINPSGKEYIPEITGPLLFGSILVLIFVSVFLLILGKTIEYLPIKVFLLILAGLFAVISIGFVVGGMQEFLSIDSTLSTTFGSFYIMFIILLTASAIFLFIWLFLVGVKLYEIKRGLRLEDY